MPRRELVVQPRSIVAAARSYGTGRRGRGSKKRDDDANLRGGEPWQRDAYLFYDLVGEYHQGCAIIGALLSRAKLVAMEVDAFGVKTPTKNPVVIAAMREFCGGPDGQSEVLRQFGIHFTVGGGGWLFGPNPNKPLGTKNKWKVAAEPNVVRRSGTWKVNGKELDYDPLAFRVWIPHPMDERKADSDTRSALTPLAQIVQLDKRSSAQIDSRLYGNGMVLFPSETAFGTMPKQITGPGGTTTVDSVVTGADGLMDLVYDAAVEAVSDPSSAAAMLPIFGEADGENIDKVKHLTWESALDKMAPQMRLDKLTSVANSLRLPKSVLLGGENSNHWNEWLADESSVKIHGEPLLKIIVEGFTEGYLWPAIEGEPGVDDPRKFVIGIDTAEMRLRPNRSKESIELHNLGELSAASMRRENGFTEADAPTEEERKRQLLFKVAGGSTTPELVNAALQEEGVDLGIAITDNRPPAEARPTPSIAEHPTREIPQRPIAASGQVDGWSVRTELVWACEALVHTALQRAGNRIKTKFDVRGGSIPAAELYKTVQISPDDADDLLKDAWAAVYERDYGVEPDELVRALTIYTKSAMMAQKDTSRATIENALKLLLGKKAA